MPDATEGLLKGDAMGPARLAAADERINRSLADAAKDPGVSESESPKKIALDTEQESTPRSSVSQQRWHC